MPLGQCVWCLRYRVVKLHTWTSPRSHEQLCGEVCAHCFYGSFGFDDCRTCRAKAERGVRVGKQSGVRPLTSADALELLRMQGAKVKRGDQE